MFSHNVRSTYRLSELIWGVRNFLCESLEGKTETIKDKVEIDEENKSLTFTALEGDLLAHYKSYKATVKINPKAEGCLMKVIVDYEKLTSDVPVPDKYLDFVVSLVKDIDAHILKP